MIELTQEQGLSDIVPYGIESRLRATDGEDEDEEIVNLPEVRYNDMFELNQASINIEHSSDVHIGHNLFGPVTIQNLQGQLHRHGQNQDIILECPSEETIETTRSRLSHILQIKLKNCSTFCNKLRIIFAVQILIIFIVLGYLMSISYNYIGDDNADVKWFYSRAEWYKGNHHHQATLLPKAKVPGNLVVFKLDSVGCDSFKMCVEYILKHKELINSSNFMIGGDGKVYELAGWDVHMPTFENNHTIDVTIVSNKITDDVVIVANKLLQMGYKTKKLKENFPVTTTKNGKPQHHDIQQYNKLLDTVREWENFVYVITRNVSRCKSDYGIIDCDSFRSLKEVDTHLKSFPFFCINLQITFVQGMPRVEGVETMCDL